MSSLWKVSSDISPTYIISSVQLCNYVLTLSDGITPPSPAQKGNDQREALQTVDLKSQRDQPFFFFFNKKKKTWFERQTPKEGDETTEVTCKQAEALQSLEIWSVNCAGVLALRECHDVRQTSVSRFYLHYIDILGCGLK